MAVRVPSTTQLLEPFAEDRVRIAGMSATSTGDLDQMLVRFGRATGASPG